MGGCWGREGDCLLVRSKRTEDLMTAESSAETVLTSSRRAFAVNYCWRLGGFGLIKLRISRILALMFCYLEI